MTSKEIDELAEIIHEEILLPRMYVRQVLVALDKIQKKETSNKQ